LLTVLKLLAGFLGNSTLLFADAVRSLSDFLNEAVKLLYIPLEDKPEDNSHNYGHGKIATLCTGAGACLLLLAGVYTFSLGLKQLLMFMHGKELEAPEAIALFAAVSAFVLRDIVLMFVEKKELQIKGISPEGYIHIKDLFISGFVIFGIIYTFLPGRGPDMADSLAAVLVSLYLLGTSGRVLYGTVNELIEASLDEETNLKIREIINNTEGVTDSRELKTRRIGKEIAINACIRVHNTLNIQEAVEITNQVEERLKITFGDDAYTLITVEPDSLKNLTFQDWSRSSKDKGKKTVIKT
jgi:cation diffusion facilitator family transporter